MALSDESISKIKALNLSDVLEQEGASLKRVGREYITHCIWHDDKNPSLTVSDEKGFTFCHVCREGGDIIHYVQSKLGLSFRDACERIAANNNIQLIYKDENSAEALERKKQIDIQFSNVKKEHERYRLQLRNSETAINFLQQRKILPQTSKQFEIGYDANENRIVIPIKDYMGRIVGFTKRAIGDQKPKYKNTENNAIFNKAELVFNEYDAIEHIRAAGECIFVEGHVDVISMWQSGIKNVVALQGTAAPSENVIRRMLRRTSSFVLCMDADEGGEKAIGMFLESVRGLALNGTVNIKIASIPAGKDPDEAVRMGSDMQLAIADADPWLDWILDKWLLGLDFSDSAKVQLVEQEVKKLISQISSAALRAHYFDKAAIRLAQNKQGVAAQILKNLQSDIPVRPSQRIWQKPDTIWTRSMVEKRLLRLYIHKPDLRFMLKPLMSRLLTPDMVWLWNRISELEVSSSVDCTPYSVMAILGIAEQKYLQKLRPLARPTVKIDESDGVLIHIENVMTKDLSPDLTGTLF